MTDLAVHCYSGHTYAQEPQSFAWQGQVYTVAEVKDMRRVLDVESSAVTVQFMVETNEHRCFRLCYNESDDCWTIDETTVW